MTNPFEQPASQQPAPAQQQPNPYAQPAAAPQAYAQPAPAQGNPFGQGVPAQAPPAQQPQYGAQGNPQWLAQPGQAAAPAQPAYAPPAAPAAPVAALDPNALHGAPPPPPTGDGRGAKMADMFGRLALFFPLAISRTARNPQFISPEQRARGDVEQDQLTATVVILDDGQGGMQPIGYGGNPHELGGKPHDTFAPLPYVRKAMWINQSRVIAQLRDYLPQPGQAPGMIVGRITKSGPRQNDPWYLETATDADLHLARTYLGLVAQGTYPHPLAA